MYYTCEFCGLTFKSQPSHAYCPYCRSSHLLEATPMEIMLQARFDDTILESFYPGLTESNPSSDNPEAA